MFGYHKRHGERGCGPEGGWRGAGRGGMFRGGPLGGRGFFEEGGEGFGGFGGRGGGGRRRQFDNNALRLMLLALLEEQPRHGYDLIREIEERTGGVYAPSPGVVYPTLTMLDELGLIDELKEEGARKRFAIGEVGRAQLAERREEADALLARLAELGERTTRGDHAPIRRAVMGVMMAVRESVSSGDGERAHAIAAILDEAARQIERLPK